MHQELKERKIWELFQQLRQEDERHAPSFANACNGTLGQVMQRGRPKLAWRSVAAVALLALLALLGGTWLMFFGQTAKPPAQDEGVGRARPSPEILPAAAELPRTSPRRHARVRPQASPVLIAQWRSPTSFLLETPGTQFLKTIRLTESVVNLKVVIPIQQN